MTKNLVGNKTLKFSQNFFLHQDSDHSVQQQKINYGDTKGKETAEVEGKIFEVIRNTFCTFAFSSKIKRELLIVLMFVVSTARKTTLSVKRLFLLKNGDVQCD